MYSRQDNVNPICTSVVPIVHNQSTTFPVVCVRWWQCWNLLVFELQMHFLSIEIRMSLVMSNGKLMLTENSCGYSLNLFGFPFGASGQCSYSTHLTSSTETVQTLRPSQFFHLRSSMYDTLFISKKGEKSDKYKAGSKRPTAKNSQIQKLSDEGGGGWRRRKPQQNLSPPPSIHHHYNQKTTALIFYRSLDTKY